jgi:Membrane domain of glycerophosphoryl diester phosphodiesterase
LSAPSFTPQLRPLSVGEMLDAGFRLFNARFMTLVLCVLVPVVPLTIIATALQASVDPYAFDLNTTETADSGTALAGTLVAAAIQFAAAALAVAACFKAISAAYLGERAGVSESLRYALGRLLPLIVAYLLFMLIFVVGFILLIIPGIWLGVKLSMLFPAVVFEREGPFGAIGRSWTLTRGHWWRTFGTLIVVFLITFVLQLVFGGVVGALLGASDTVSELTVAIVLTLVNLITLAVTYPLWAAVTTVLYYDLRVRNEGFDLQLLARGMGADATRFESAPERPFAPPPEPASEGFVPPEGHTRSS